MVTNLRSEVLEQQMLLENSKLEELRYAVLDMMDDYNANHVRQANLEYVQIQLDRIEKARREFRTSVRQYKRIFSRYSSAQKPKCSLRIWTRKYLSMLTLSGARSTI